ncbi:SDR family NAD(P)-dependent oxidoreductase [Methylobacterium oryzihabitans]|uniref:SDR family NAD(P)-dependent oxidoreductase n=1 Tax=Methylobacterium oryzihabitans TaxID=2499852 RepID=A0A3S3U366_9HYPH|nr:SDR family NAD(P)-dependent oxidoreductase [Methylobacterium oryzihabitans]RVU14431.1 SDR family NAD(P)-dependent oxidoreductase [Methylobacterium oryzihabitans]
MDARDWTLVTGASSGIGAAIARAFAARGHALVLTARREDRLRDLAAELGGLVPVEVVPADLAEPEAPGRLLARVAERGIALHTLVNNAGFGLRGRLVSHPEADVAGMIALNVAAPTMLARLILPDLIARRRGGILNVASVVAYLPGPNMAVYHATKAYLLSLSEALHEEARPHGVVVTAACPGTTATEFNARAGEWGSRRRRGGMSAEAVARIAVDGHCAGRAVVVTGLANRAAVLGARLAPRRLSRKVAARIQG